jgi:hypothetical protein
MVVVIVRVDHTGHTCSNEAIMNDGYKKIARSAEIVYVNLKRSSLD